MEINQGIIRGQVVPHNDAFVQESLKPFPVFAHCPNPSCGNIGPTKVAVKMNILNCLFSAFCGTCWFLNNACNRKEMACHDADHHCIKCGGRIGSYSSW